jgi:MEMO1 family protein
VFFKPGLEAGVIRSPAVAGSFYPEDPEELGDMVARCLPASPSEEPFLAVLAPHAGYVYSGRVAGATYARVAVPSRVILLGPNHTGRGPALSLWDGGAWTMPGGSVEIDAELCAVLRRHCPRLAGDSAAHLREHCIEVQIPFLQARRGAFRMAPIVVGTSRLEDLQDLGRGIAGAVREIGGKILIVISSDMSHYEPADRAAVRDRLALEAMTRLDPEGLHRIVLEEGISMCGAMPAVAGLTAARELGARRGQVILYSHSGEVSGDTESVVGYAGMVFS